jgi:hypothetical protein
MKAAALVVFLLATLCVAQEAQEPAISRDCMQAMASAVWVHSRQTVKASVLEKTLPPQLPPGYTTVLLKINFPVLRPYTPLNIEVDGKMLSVDSRVVLSGLEPMGTIMAMVPESEAEMIRNASELKVTFVDF